MNILFLPTAYPNIYNDHSSIFVQDQAEALVKSGLNVSVIGAIPISFKYIFQKKIFKFGNFESEKNGVTVGLFLFPSIPKLRRFNQFIRYSINKALMKKYLKSHNDLNIIHVHNATAGEAALWMKNNYRIPYCITEHSSAFSRGTISKSEVIRYAEVYRNSSHNIAVSKEFCNLLEEIYKVKFHYIPNVVDTSFFIPVKQKKKKEFNFINIANLNENKNHTMLVKAFTTSFKDQKSIKLSILGAGPEYHNLKKEIKKLGMEGQITLFGFATRKQVSHELQKADVFVFSSNYETFGVVLIEAMSCGLPVVATKCGGAESIVENSKLGMLVEKNSDEEMSKAMKQIYEKKQTYNSEYIREYIIQHFSESSVTIKLIDVYREVFNEN